ncbi:hypothetical protein SDRG_16611 [Saprolegnia diclina VS20]|uniref:F-box domain-containing protein n=1 Tax=Saprolegnia diclina (strain VS20) TaxID=1156394 RepID=T0R0N1_SAPDV|nr:hypothetical protein SDRG_16611 [Saprolegnia diclina VS20]EQC25528.1 hypothetical protein SDRG_16611 [Saprolegnia diclina VS20]|eukprot:XP_008621049.1 hypothetical protein SDRG_16611 [Saprolegnia diclina VS20]
MAAKRPSPSPASVLDIIQVLVSIVQCTLSPSDVASFLHALPPATLTPPLAALVQLLSSQEPSSVWPMPNLCDVNDTRAAKNTLVTAMPVFHSMSIGRFSQHNIVFPITGISFDAPFCRFVANWATKVTHVQLLKSPTTDQREACYSVLRQCTNLQHAFLPCETPLLDAITTPAHRVSDLRLNLTSNKSAYTSDVVPAIERWLASGYARHLALTWLTTPDARLAQVLASSTPSDLALCVSPGVVQSLVANGIALTHLKKLDLTCGSSARTADGFRHLAPVLDLPNLKELTLESKRDGAYCMLVLPSMVSLQDLSLCAVDLTEGEMAPLYGPYVLCRARFDYVNFSTASFGAVLDWALRSPQLESIAWSSCSHIEKRIDQAARAMQQCIAAGVRHLSFRHCNINRTNVTVLADALAGTCAREPFEMDLSFNTFTVLGQRYLTAALATCTNITIRLEGQVSKYFADEDQVHATEISVAIRCEGLCIYVCSPTPPSSSTSA